MFHIRRKLIRALAAKVAMQVEFIDSQAMVIDAQDDLLERLRAERDELLEDLTDVVWQACWVGGALDSGALSAYADAMRLLAKHGIINITHEYGRRVIAVQAGTRLPASELSDG